MCRHTILGFRSVVCIPQKYTLTTSPEEVVVHLEIPPSLVPQQNLYTPIEHDTDTNMYSNSIKISTVNLEIVAEIERYKKCLSGSQSFGIFFWGSGFIAGVWFDHFSYYKTPESPVSGLVIYSMITIENLLSWSAKTTTNLETIVPKFYKILEDVSKIHEDECDSIISYLSTLKTRKEHIKAKISAYNEELENVNQLLKDVHEKVTAEEKEYNSNSGLETKDVFRKNKNKEVLDKLYNSKQKLFNTKDTLSAKLSLLHYNQDCITYFTKSAVTNLQKVLDDT